MHAGCERTNEGTKERGNEVRAAAAGSQVKSSQVKSSDLYYGLGTLRSKVVVEQSGQTRSSVTKYQESRPGD